MKKLKALFKKLVDKIRGYLDPDYEPKPSDPGTPADPGKPSEPAKPSFDDAVDFNSFQWKYGGTNGSGAKMDGSVMISLKGISANRIDYRWEHGNPQTWGAKDAQDHKSAIVCAFLKDNSGKWIGGKFDWVSTSRLFRSFNHFGNSNPGSGYNGWSLHNIPNPTELAFVVIDNKSKRRTNVISGTWKRASSSMLTRAFVKIASFFKPNTH